MPSFDSSWLAAGRRVLAATVLSLAACSDDSSPGPSWAVPPQPTTNAGVAAPPVAGTGVAGANVAQPVGGTAGQEQPPTGAGMMGAVSGGAGGASGAGGTGVDPIGTEMPDETMPAGSGDWAMMGYDHASTFFNRAETTITKENAVNLKEAWSVNMGGNVYGAPLQIGDVIYASGPSSVRALDAASGDELWTHSVGSTSSLAYDNGTLYLNDNGSKIVSIDAATGNENWAKAGNPDSMADGSSSALVAGDVVLIGGSNGTIELIGGTFRGFLGALDRMTGSVAWTEYTVPTGAKGASIWSSPSADVAAGRAYASTGNNYGRPATDSSDAIIAFDLATGKTLWKNQRVENDTFGGGGLGAGPDADFGANPVLFETMIDGVMTKVVSAGNKGGVAHAVLAEDGAFLWERSLCGGAADGSRGIFTNSAWTGKYMLFACNEGTRATLYALDGATGDMGWSKPLPGLVWGRTAVANGVGFVGTGNKLQVFDADTGEHITEFTSKGGTVASTITVAHGRVAFGEGLSWSSGVRGSMLTVLTLP